MVSSAFASDSAGQLDKRGNEMEVLACHFLQLACVGGNTVRQEHRNQVCGKKSSLESRRIKPMRRTG